MDAVRRGVTVTALVLGVSLSRVAPALAIDADRCSETLGASAISSVCVSLGANSTVAGVPTFTILPPAYAGDGQEVTSCDVFFFFLAAYDRNRSLLRSAAGSGGSTDCTLMAIAGGTVPVVPLTVRCLPGEFVSARVYGFVRTVDIPFGQGLAQSNIFPNEPC